MSAKTIKKDFQTLVADMLADLQSPAPGRVPITDANEGSVVRTLVEAFGREMALVYEQIERVYRMGYLDTAEGQALDQVVALLSVVRRPAGWLEGEVTFRRGTPATADIQIPAGTLVAGEKPAQGEPPPLCRTTIAAVLPEGGTEVTVPVRTVERVDWPQDAGPIQLSFMPRPILGIERVANQADLRPGLKEETDEELRDRARHAVDDSNLGTLSALRSAVASLGYADVKIEEQPQLPGTLEILVDTRHGTLTEDETKSLKLAINEAKPAGVYVSIRGIEPKPIKVRAVIVLEGDRTEAEKKAVLDACRRAAEAFFAQIKIGESVRWEAVKRALSSHPLVFEVKTLDDKDPLVGGTVDSETRDVLLTSDQRARLDPDLQLRLETRALPVLVDVELVGDESKKEALRKHLQAVLAGVNKSPQKPIELKAVRSSLTQPPELASILATAQLTFIHRDGRVIELRNADDKHEGLKVNEAAQLRYLRFVSG